MLEYMKQRMRLGRAIRMVWESSPKWTLAGVVVIAVQGLLPLAGLYLVKLIIDTVTAGIATPDAPGVLRQVVLLVALAGLVAFVTAVFDALSNLVNEIQAQIVTDHMQAMIHSKAIEVDLEYYENTEYQNSLHRAQQEAPHRPTKIVKGLLQLAQNSVSLLGVAALLITFHWAIVGILLLASIPGILVRMRYAQTMYHWRKRQTLTERKAEYFNFLLTIDVFAKEIRMFGLGPLFQRKFRHFRQIIRRERIAIARQRAIAEVATQSIALVPVFGILGYAAYQTVGGAITVGTMVMYYQAIQRGQSYLQSLLQSVAALYEDNLFLTHIYEFLDLKKKVAEPAHPEEFPRPMRKGIVFEDVHFQYPMTERTALEGISLTLRPGEIIALVGENGSGKTTLTKMLCRLYDPTHGRITVDGIDLRRFHTTALRRQISVIFQDYNHYQMTARENIWLGDSDMPLDDERVIAAARHSGADELISNLEKGYETPLGRWLENGEELSVGEWQKIALARAFLRDAQVVVLDEPTSSMDPKAEYEIFQRFRDLIEDRSAILISHRLSTVRMADCIYLMERGRIAESGTHDELMRLGGTYARLFDRQAENYRVSV